MPRGEKAFTIIELLVVIAIILVLTSFLLVAFRGVEEKARSKDTKSKIQRIETQISAYYGQRRRLPETGVTDDATTAPNENGPTLLFAKGLIQANAASGANVTIQVDSLDGFVNQDFPYEVYIYEPNGELSEKALCISLDVSVTPPTLTVATLARNVGVNWCVMPDTVFTALASWQEGKFAIDEDTCLDGWGQVIHVALQPDYPSVITRDAEGHITAMNYRQTVTLIKDGASGAVSFVQFTGPGASDTPYNNQPGGFQIVSVGPDGEWDSLNPDAAVNEDNITNMPDLSSYYGVH